MAETTATVLRMQKRVRVAASHSVDTSIVHRSSGTPRHHADAAAPAAAAAAAVGVDSQTFERKRRMIRQRRKRYTAATRCQPPSQHTRDQTSHEKFPLGRSPYIYLTNEALNASDIGLLGFRRFDLQQSITRHDFYI